MKRRFSDVRRALIRRLDTQDDSVLKALRDDIWERLIARGFMRGYSVEYLVRDQPTKNSTTAIEAAIRAQARKRRQL